MASALRVGDPAPEFALPAHTGEKIRLSDFRGKKNVVLAFFPLNWTPVCSGQIPHYHEKINRFNELDAQVLAVSVDSIPSHQSWVYTMGGLDYPLLSDFWPHGDLAQKYGVFIDDAGHSERALFVIDKLGIIRYIDISDLDVEPEIKDLFAALEQIQNNVSAK